MNAEKDIIKLDLSQEAIQETQPNADIGEKGEIISYRKMLNGNMSNLFAQIHYKGKVEDLPLAPTSLDGKTHIFKFGDKVDSEGKYTQLELFLDPATDLRESDEAKRKNPFVDVFEYNLRVQQFRDCIDIGLTQQIDQYKRLDDIPIGDFTVRVPLDKMTEFFGRDPTKKTNIDKTRWEVENILENLFRIRVNYRKTGGKDRDFKDVRLVSGKEISNGIIEFEATKQYVDYLRTSGGILFYPTGLGAISGQRGNIIYLTGRILALQFSNRYLARKGINNTIKVRTLVEKLTAGSCLPAIEEIRKSKNRGVDRQIITPVERALDDLVEKNIIKGWCYTDKKREKLTDEALESLSKYDEWVEQTITFDFLDNNILELEKEKEKAKKRLEQNTKKG